RTLPMCARPSLLKNRSKTSSQTCSSDQLQVMLMSWNEAVWVGSLVLKITSYCKYWALGLAIVPPLATAAHADQLPSGVAVFPLRVSTVMLVPAGKEASQVAVPQVAIRVALKIDDTNVPPDVYESTRIQSACSAGDGEPL